MTSTTVNPQHGPFARIPNSGPGIWLVGGWGPEGSYIFEKNGSTTLHFLQNAGARCNCLQRCNVVLPFFSKYAPGSPQPGDQTGGPPGPHYDFRTVLRFLAGLDGGPSGFTLVGGSFAVPGPVGGADIDAGGELWVGRAARATVSAH